MAYQNTNCEDLHLDLCKTKDAAIARADYQAARGRTVSIYSTLRMIVAQVEAGAGDGAPQSATNVRNIGDKRWVVASWRKPA